MLYVVATPIGNLADMSPRGVETLRSVSVIACEDTRRTGKLLQHFGISTPLLSYHEHNEEERTPQLLDRLGSGEDVALVSDAGTPLLSDPGYRLVRACREADIAVVPVPGPFAAAAAASVSGLPTDRLLFAGFPPARAGKRRQWWKELAAVSATVVCYLSPHRLHAELREALAAFGPREAFLARELTKLHEECWFGRLPDLVERVAEQPPRGEYTLVLAPAAGTAPSCIDVRAYCRGLRELYGLSPAQAAARAAAELGLSRREVYRLAQQDES
ncbi:MAG: 16S rRNA (cytidine(1402)-2'-O)-methyltransferase [Acidobacteriota bacterium]